MKWPFNKSESGTQTMPKATSHKSRQGQPDGASKPKLHQYYLGEDPFKSPLFSPQMQDRQYQNVRNVRKEVRMMRKSQGSPSSTPVKTVTMTTISNSNSGECDPRGSIKCTQSI